MYIIFYKNLKNNLKYNIKIDIIFLLNIKKIYKSIILFDISKFLY